MYQQQPQHPPRPTSPFAQVDPSKMSNREIEKILGMQYSQMVQSNKELSSVYKDAKEVINVSLDLMDKYNRMNLMLKQKAQQVKNSFC